MNSSKNIYHRLQTNVPMLFKYYSGRQRLCCITLFGHCGHIHSSNSATSEIHAFVFHNFDWICYKKNFHNCLKKVIFTPRFFGRAVRTQVGIPVWHGSFVNSILSLFWHLQSCRPAWKRPTMDLGCALVALRT